MATDEVSQCHTAGSPDLSPALGYAGGSARRPMLEGVTIEQLRTLQAVASAGSFSAAARKLGRVQAAVSQSIDGERLALSAKEDAHIIPLARKRGRVFGGGGRARPRPR